MEGGKGLPVKERDQLVLPYAKARIASIGSSLIKDAHRPPMQ